MNAVSGDQPGVTIPDYVPVTAILVTHNSQGVVERAMSALLAGSEVPHRIIVVDSGSDDLSYLASLSFGRSDGKVITAGANVGFCVGNNLGLPLAEPADDVLLLNPDAFVSPAFLRDSRAFLAQDPQIGAIGPKLCGFDLATDTVTGLIDSAGVFQTGWGRFRDRGQREPDHGQYDQTQDAVALCGAALLLRRSALDQVLLSDQIFDPAFFMYKEDIDLAIRLQRAGWRTVYFPQATVLHCRGWKADRGAMPAWTRRRSLINEWRIWLRGWTPNQSRWRALPYLIAKSVAVLVGA